SYYFEQLDTVHARHANVADDNVVTGLIDVGHGFLPARRNVDVVSLIPQLPRQDLANARVVIHQEQARSMRGSRRPRCGRSDLRARVDVVIDARSWGGWRRSGTPGCG